MFIPSHVQDISDSIPWFIFITRGLVELHWFPSLNVCQFHDASISPQWYGDHFHNYQSIQIFEYHIVIGTFKEKIFIFI